MTRVVGYYVTPCPACGARYRETSYGSVFRSGCEIWSDNWRSLGLGESYQGLAACACGQLFIPWRERAEYVDISLPLWPEPTDWQLLQWELALLWDAIVAKVRGMQPTERPRPLPKGFTPPPLPPPSPPHVVSPTPAAIASALTGDLPAPVELVARRLYWRELNHPYRTDPPHQGVNPHPDFASNLRRLTELLEPDDDAGFLELGEVYRQLGEFEKAQVYLTTSCLPHVQPLLELSRSEAAGVSRLQFRS